MLIKLGGETNPQEAYMSITEASGYTSFFPIIPHDSELGHALEYPRIPSHNHSESRITCSIPSQSLRPSTITLESNYDIKVEIPSKSYDLDLEIASDIISARN